MRASPDQTGGALLPEAQGDLNMVRKMACVRKELIFASMALTMMETSIMAARAQETSAADPLAEPAPVSPQEADERQIVVIGQRVIIASLEDIPVEREYDEDDVASYAVSTVGELLDTLRQENGDDAASLLINGRPVRNGNEIADLPVEAIQRIETLPRGSAQRIGGGAGQRAYNVVLRSSVRSITLTGSREAATDGGWHNWRGEAIVTRIKQENRFNLTMRIADSDPLFQSERPLFIPRAETTPYSSAGNIQPLTGSVIDPSLAALVGSPVTVLAVPEGNSAPTLAQLAEVANRINPSNNGAYRSLRGASRNYEIALSSNTRIADWLSLSTNSRLSLSRGSTFAGLPSARFQIPSTNPFSPFANTVTIAVNDPARPLQNRNRFDGGSASATLNADLGDWRSSLSARYDLRNGAFESTSVGPFTSNSLVLGQDTNPFTGDLGLLIPLTTREANSRTSIVKVDYDSDGPIVNLWAGPLLGRFGLGANWLGFDAQDTSGPRVFNRHEYEARTGFTLPLTSASPESLFLAAMGSSELAADIGLVDLGQYGTLERHSFAFNWQLRPWIRFVAYQNRDETALSPELFSSPVIVAPNVPYFDPLNGQTVDVSLIAGGAGGLTNQVVRTRKLEVARFV